MVLIQVDVSDQQLAGVRQSSQALQQRLILFVGLGNETGVVIEAESVLFDDILSDLGEVAMGIDGNAVMLSVVHGGLFNIIVCVGKINVDAHFFDQFIQRIEIAFEGVFDILLIVHKAHIGEVAVVVGIGAVQGVVVIVVAHGGHLDLDHAGELLVEFLDQVQQGVLVGLADDAPHIQLHIFQIINDKIAILISGQIVHDAAEGIGITGLGVLAAACASQQERGCQKQAEDPLDFHVAHSHK